MGYSGAGQYGTRILITLTLIVSSSSRRPDSSPSAAAESSQRHYYEIYIYRLSLLKSQVKYALDKYGGDAKKVFVTGSSSGGMVTNALIAAYPDVFAGGASFSGAPAFGCWSGAGTTASGGAADPDCASAAGKKVTTAQQWGDLARSGDPAFNGTAATRPLMQIWHGTADSVVTYGYLADQLAQWANVAGVAFSKNVTDDPERGYTKMVYGDGTKVVGYSAQGVGHMVPFHEKQVLEFFGLLPAAS